MIKDDYQTVKYDVSDKESMQRFKEKHGLLEVVHTFIEDAEDQYNYIYVLEDSSLIVRIGDKDDFYYVPDINNKKLKS